MNETNIPNVFIDIFKAFGMMPKEEETHSNDDGR